MTWSTPIAVVDYRTAERVTRELPAWALLSIRDPMQPQGCPATTGPRLDLAFDDIGRWMSIYACPQRGHADRIVAFARALHADPPPGLVVHCAAGISRSSAAVVGVLAAVGADPVHGLLDAVRFTVGKGWRDPGDSVRPNPRLVALLDAALDADGDLVRQVLGVWHPSRGSIEDVLTDAACDP